MPFAELLNRLRPPPAPQPLGASLSGQGVPNQPSMIQEWPECPACVGATCSSEAMRACTTTCGKQPGCRGQQQRCSYIGSRDGQVRLPPCSPTQAALHHGRPTQPTHAVLFTTLCLRLAPPNIVMVYITAHSR